MAVKENSDRLCLLAKKKKLKKIQKLSDEPSYICSKCCRVARSEDNLCKPRPFE